MGIIYSCDRQRGIIFIVWDGEVTWEDWRAHIHMLQADPDWYSIVRVIADLQTVTDTTSMGVKEIEQAAANFGLKRDTLARKRCAVLARDEFGKAKRFGEFISSFGVTLIVFNSLDTACLFLDLDLKETRRILDGLRAALRTKTQGNVQAQAKQESA
jgi:hypothetical protein